MHEIFSDLNLYVFGPLGFLFSLVAMIMSFVIRKKIVIAFEKKLFREEAKKVISSFNATAKVLKNIINSKKEGEALNFGELAGNLSQCCYRYSFLRKQTRKTSSDALNLIKDLNMLNPDQAITLLNYLTLITADLEKEMI